MPKAALLFAAVLLVGCSKDDRVQTREDARKLGEDIKHDAKKADEVLSKDLEKARVNAKEDAEKLKHKVHDATK